MAERKLMLSKFSPECSFTRQQLVASALRSNPLAMDTHGQAQQQKDFMSAFFPPQGDHPNANIDRSQHHQNLFNGQGLHPGMINTGMQALSNMNNGSNVTSDIDMLQNLMAMQGMESHSPVQANQQAPYNMLEQQFKLTQLQQLQQLQNQIFQQQVSTISLLSVWRLVMGRNGCKSRQCFTWATLSVFTISCSFQIQIALISGQQIGQLSDLSPNPQQDQRSSHHQGLPTPGEHKYHWKIEHSDVEYRRIVVRVASAAKQ